MLHQIGRKSPASAPDGNDAVGTPGALLLECHGRIRGALQTARAVASAGAVAGVEIAEAAGVVERYFAEALPLHVRDEDETLSARLAGRSGACDEALRRMRDEHRSHEPMLAALIDLCGRLRREPASHAELAPRLGALLDELEPALALHLEEEERDVFPALAELSPDEQAAMVLEIRARRGA